MYRNGAYNVSKQYASQAAEKLIDPATLRVEAQDGDVVLVGKGNQPATLTHWSFGQISNIAGAPAGYLRRLPATLASQNINHGLKQRFSKTTMTVNTADPVNSNQLNMMCHVNGGIVVRSLNSDKYSRIWNHELLGRMLDFGAYGWANPVPFATTNTEGQQGEPTIYVSDHDMFVFQVNNRNRIKEPNNPDGLGRGFFVENSEVGAAKWRITTFLYRYMCSNHIIWGSKSIREISVKHIGDAHDRVMAQFGALSVELKRYAESSASEDEAKISSAKSRLIPATDKDNLLDWLFQKLRGQITRANLEASYELAYQNEITDGSAMSYWGIAQGMTRHSQTLDYTDDRVMLDRAAGKVLDMAF